MRVWTSSCVCLLALAGCGAPAIVDASTTIAGLRGCEPVELSVAATETGYDVSGCGAAAAYACPDGACSESGEADDAWASEATGVLAALASDALECNHGAPATIQVRLDGEGHPQAMVTELQGDERGCVGRLVLAATFPASGTDRLVSFAYGQAVPATSEPVASEPPMEAPVGVPEGEDAPEENGDVDAAPEVEGGDEAVEPAP